MAFLTLEIRQGPATEGATTRSAPTRSPARETFGAGVVARSNTDLQRVIDRVLAHEGIVRCSSVIARATQVPYRVLPLLGSVTG